MQGRETRAVCLCKTNLSSLFFLFFFLQSVRQPLHQPCLNGAFTLKLFTWSWKPMLNSCSVQSALGNTAIWQTRLITGHVQTSADDELIVHGDWWKWCQLWFPFSRYAWPRWLCKWLCKYSELKSELTSLSSSTFWRSSLKLKYPNTDKASHGLQRLKGSRMKLTFYFIWDK